MTRDTFQLSSARFRVGLGVVAIGFALGYARGASACASCGCGDPTLTSLGAEKPFRNRLRLSLDGRYRTDKIGQFGVDQIALNEWRLDGQVAWAPHERLFLVGTVPLLARTVSYVNGGEIKTTGIGDIELRAKAFVFQDRVMFPQHLLAVHAGIKIPTAPMQHGPDGSKLPIEVQPGTGSWDPLVGVSYAFFTRPWSFYTSASAAVPLRGTDEFRASRSLRLAASVQRQFIPQLALRLGADVRIDGKSYEDGAPERDSGGAIAFASPELLISPITDLIFVLSVRVPVVQALNGYHREGPILGFAIAYDL